jgi:hypothetical protein
MEVEPSEVVKQYQKSSNWDYYRMKANAQLCNMPLDLTQARSFLHTPNADTFIQGWWAKVLIA